MLTIFIALAGVFTAGIGLWAFYTLIKMPGHSYSGRLLPLSETEIEIRNNLKGHVETLAGRIGERNIWNYAALQESAQYIENNLRKYLYSVRSHAYTVEGLKVRNLEIQIPGTTLPSEIIIVGAHYDSVYGCPGANDNATGVASLLETARLLAKRRFRRTIRLVAFVNEEPPIFRTANMGSLLYALKSREQHENIAGMISIETIGYYSNVKGSQVYPFPINFFYPDTANFIAFVGNIASRDLVRRSIRAFRKHTNFPSEGVAAPSWIPGVDWSDHWSFWQQGYRGIMITDTAFYRYAQYHTVDDTPEKVDYDRLARVVAGLARMVADLAENGAF